VKVLEWSDKYRVSIPQFDAQHHRIFDLLGELAKSAQGDEGGTLVVASLEELHEYAEQHLAREELLLRIRSYPRYREHKAEHDAYREKIASFEGQLGRTDLNIRMANFLTEWWHYHILTSDRHYAQFFQTG
jgi:hemerythrin